MHGDGTRMDIIPNNPRARCLDLTRLVSRVGRGPLTGIDRVELAYLTKLLSIKDPFFSLIKMGRLYFLLDRTGTDQLHQKLTGKASWGAASWKSQIFRKRSDLWRRAFSDIQYLSVGTAIDAKLSRKLCGLLPIGTTYLNVGHSNLNATTFDAIRQIQGSRISVLIHDTIPLDYPQFQRAGSVGKFECKLRMVAENADLVIFNSAISKGGADLYFRKWRLSPETLVAHLGVEVQKPAFDEIPKNLDPGKPYFVTVGTIEPRKNHALLLEIWRRWPAEKQLPALIIIGSRGWNNQSVFDLLDTDPTGVTEVNGLSDGAVSALQQGSSGLLFPSLAEGFGLPPAEAALLKVPVVCGHLEIYKEVLGDYPVYADLSDMYQWETIIQKMADSSEAKHEKRKSGGATITLPSWNDHFNLVLNVT